MAWIVEVGDEFGPEFYKLQQDVQTEILAHSRLLQQFGPQLGRPRVDTLNGSRHANMKELRFSAADGEWRVAFAFDPRRKAILLVAGNTMSQAVRERTGELGVLKAIGFTNVQVVALVLIESSLVAVLGGVAGLGLAWLVISRGDPTGGLLPMFFLPGRDLVFGAGLCVALGLATGIFPAIQALRLRTADALRRM